MSRKRNPWCPTCQKTLEEKWWKLKRPGYTYCEEHQKEYWRARAARVKEEQLALQMELAELTQPPIWEMPDPEAEEAKRLAKGVPHDSVTDDDIRRLLS